MGINISPVEETSSEDDIRHFLHSANFLSIDCLEIINENIQVYGHLDIEILECTILNPISVEIVQQEVIENLNLKSGPSISEKHKNIIGLCYCGGPSRRTTPKLIAIQ